MAKTVDLRACGKKGSAAIDNRRAKTPRNISGVVGPTGNPAEGTAATHEAHRRSTGPISAIDDLYGELRAPP